MLCRPFGDLSRALLCYVGSLVTLAVFGCYVGPLVTLAMFGYAMLAFWRPLPCLAMLLWPFGDLSGAWLYYVGPLVILAMFGYVM